MTRQARTQPSPPRPTIRSVAKQVGLSPTTVSLALRGDQSIPPETRKRILVAAEELGYHYVPRGKRRGTGQVHRFVYVLQDYHGLPVASNPFYSQVLAGGELACRTQNASLSLYTLPHDLAPDMALPPSLTSDLDGVLLTSPFPASIVERVANETGCPVVLIDNYLPGAGFDSVMADDFGGALTATRHLLGLGHSRIAMVAGRAMSADVPPSYQERYRGYCTACTLAGCAPHPLLVLPRQAEEISDLGRQALQEWLAELLRRPPLPTALFCSGDLIAAGILSGLHRLGKRVPDELSIMGFDDFDISTMTNVALTTTHVYKKALGQVAVERLHRRVQGDLSPACHISIGTQLVLRESVGPPPHHS